LASYTSGPERTQPRENRFSIDDKSAAERLANGIYGHLAATGGRRPIVVICIGTDRSTGDALGPLVGTRLENMKLPWTTVYGTLAMPVHATNLKDCIALVNAEHKDPFVVAIDACLGKAENIGTVTIGEGKLKPGAGVNKDLPALGDIYLTGVVNVGGFMEYFVLQNTRLYVVYRLASLIVEGLQMSLLRYANMADVSQKA
jgi:putative sporulation protein YyaC